MGRRLKISREDAREKLVTWRDNKLKAVEKSELAKAKKRIQDKLNVIEKMFDRKWDKHKKKYGYGQKGHPY
jgi:hypothetical protein